MCDANIYSGSGGDVTRLSGLFLLVSAEKASVMALLYHNECDTGFVIRLQLDAGLSHGRQLVLQDVNELSLWHPVSVHDDPVWLVATRALIEHYQEFTNHTTHFLDYFLPRNIQYEEKLVFELAKLCNYQLLILKESKW